MSRFFMSARQNSPPAKEPCLLSGDTQADHTAPNVRSILFYKEILSIKSFLSLVFNL